MFQVKPGQEERWISSMESHSATQIWHEGETHSLSKVWKDQQKYRCGEGRKETEPGSSLRGEGQPGEETVQRLLSVDEAFWEKMWNVAWKYHL